MAKGLSQKSLEAITGALQIWLIINRSPLINAGPVHIRLDFFSLLLGHPLLQNPQIALDETDPLLHAVSGPESVFRRVENIIQ